MTRNSAVTHQRSNHSNNIHLELPSIVQGRTQYTMNFGCIGRLPSQWTFGDLTGLSTLKKPASKTTFSLSLLLVALAFMAASRRCLTALWSGLLPSQWTFGDLTGLSTLKKPASKTTFSLSLLLVALAFMAASRRCLTALRSGLLPSQWTFGDLTGLSTLKKPASKTTFSLSLLLVALAFMAALAASRRCLAALRSAAVFLDAAVAFGFCAWKKVKKFKCLNWVELFTCSEGHWWLNGTDLYLLAASC